MAQLLSSNQEFNDLLKGIKIEKNDFEALSLGVEETNVDEVIAKLATFWKAIKPILKLVKIITPKKIDKGIDEFIAIVDKLTGGAEGEEQSALLEKFAVVWGIVVPVLESVKSITPPKADAIINEVIKIGNLLSTSE